LPPLIVVLLTAAAIVGVSLLVEQVDSSRRSQIAIGSVSQTVKALEAAPFSADARFNSGADARSPELAAIVSREIRADEAKISNALSSAARAGAPAALIAAGRSRLAEVSPAVVRVYLLATKPGGLASADPSTIAAAQAGLSHRLGDLSAVLSQIVRADAARAQTARDDAEIGTAAAMLLLLAVFGYFYFRSERLGRENEALLWQSREEASTDLLTGLGNRRALTDALASAIDGKLSGEQELLVAMFDLDGFKQYNDTFGHAAGDALLTRLGGRLAVALEGSGSAHRMGGDEFCILARIPDASAEALLDDALAALTDRGEGWEVGCSHGAVWVPSEADTPTEALHIADLRMYANKETRSSTGRQIADALLQVLSEQDATMDVHGGHVAVLSGEVALALHLSDREVQRIRLAATLHDIGKTAIPDSILKKAGPLDEKEWEFMHRHTLIGERIVLAAPALASTAPLVRSSHERLDGGGYPDRLQGEQIPLGSRIIAACDAFDAMISKRSYRDATTPEAAFQELTRCSGSQFDPAVLEALQTVVASGHGIDAPLLAPAV
jgi:diguanylate cyclase (GGDEF)-like protein